MKNSLDQIIAKFEQSDLTNIIVSIIKKKNIFYNIYIYFTIYLFLFIFIYIYIFIFILIIYRI